MAETVFSMARSILGSAVSKAASAAAEEMSLLMGVQKEIWFMKDELKTMQACLISGEAMKKKKLLLKVWAEQVRSLSHDIEDCLDEFMVHVASQSLTKQLMKLKDRHRIAVQIRNLKSRVEEVSGRNTRYNLIKTDTTSIDEAHSYIEDVRNHSAGNIDEAELVGFDTGKQLLLDMISTQDNVDNALVICVVGTGGLGKTTLVKKIYESKEAIGNNFSYCAWITVSQSFSRIEMLQDIIRKLFGDNSVKTCLEKLEGNTALQVQVEHLGKYLIEQLREKRYFIVLDDLWTIDAWIWIRDICFPSNNKKASRIVITTRDVSLAEDCTTRPFILELKPLEKEHSVDLLLRKLRKSKQDMENDERLKTTVTKLVKKCGGLPLAIVTIGAMFAAKHISHWEKLYRQLPSELENNLSLEAIKMMVTLSFNHLPSYLKPCFLYLTIFPEDFEIERRRLVDRWIADGLVRARVGVTLEDVGKGYFQELISRSMIQPSRVNLEGVVKSCRVHDILRDIIVALSREEGFVSISADNIPSLVEQNFCHVAYHVKKLSPVQIDWSRVRSLTIFGKRPIEHAPSLCAPQLRMLRALDLENAYFTVTQEDANNIGLLRHLKYLKIGPYFEKCPIYELPRSIGKMQGLQVLSLSNTYISTLPTEICKLQSLHTLSIPGGGNYSLFDPGQPVKCLMNLFRLPVMFTSLVNSTVRNQATAELHMACSRRWSTLHGVKVPRGVGNLKDLRILNFVSIKRTSSEAIVELGDLSKLRKLGVITNGATKNKCMKLWKSIEKLSSLSALTIYADYGTVEWVSFVSSHTCLRTLALWGRIGDKVACFRDLTKLAKLCLGESELEEGTAVEILGAMPKLMSLHLYKAAYAGEEFVFREGAFLNLRKLYIWAPTQLREIRFEQHASPQMESIKIGDCRLERGINGIKHHPKLREIHLWHELRVARMGVLQDEVNAHPNQPLLRLSEDRGDHNLGDDEAPEEYFDAMDSIPDHDWEGAEAITTTSSDS